MTAETTKRSRVEDGEDEVDPKLVASLEKLQEIQEELEKIDEDESNEVLEVEKKVEELRRPVYSKRANIIKSIPDFWLTAFMSHPALGDLLTEKDEKIFKHLISLDVEDDASSGYSITFYFSQNPYFEDLKLTKSLNFEKGGKSTQIRWKDGMGISNGPANKKGSKRSHTEDSFFSWFDVKEKDGVVQMTDAYDEVAVVIKEDLWPNPLKYFINDVEEDSDEDDEEGKEADDDDDEEDDTEDDV